jgi:hypothetical protein
MVVYRYLAANNPSGLFLDGVPLRDLTQEDIDELPGHLAASVAESELYEAVAEPTAQVGRRLATKANAAAAVVAAPSVDQGE